METMELPLRLINMERIDPAYLNSPLPRCSGAVRMAIIRECPRVFRARLSQLIPRAYLQRASERKGETRMRLFAPYAAAAVAVSYVRKQ